MPGIISELSDVSHSTDLSQSQEPIAIVGFDFRFPGDATSEDAFWEMLVKGQYDEPNFPSDRFTVESFRHPRDKKPGTIPARGAHFLKDDISKFDASFFSITPTEAAAMDPMQRGVLEITYRTLENAGISIESVAGSKTSVHVGCFGSDYNVIQARDPEQLPMYTATGLPFSVLSNRVSWFFDFRGPSATIDTACSSAFVALDQACQAIHNGSATMGVVAGCNLISTPDSVAALCRMGFLSPDGYCHSFDERASGYARGEGFAAMIVKPLSRAVRDNDTIRAVIRATRTNQDGRTLGMTQPSAEAQELLIRETYESAGLERSQTQYVEAHGTGTAIGDPTEASAIAAAFKDVASPEAPLYVGSVKANIGHLEPVSGLAGLIKTVLALEKGIIPPIAQLKNLNPKLAIHHHLEFPKKHVSWPSNGLRRASINSFGFGGTNAHIVLEDAYHHLQSAGLIGNHKTLIGESLPSTDSSAQSSRASSVQASTAPSDDGDGNSNAGSDTKPKLLVWSSTDPKGLERQVNNYEAFLSGGIAALDDPDQYLRDLSYTLGSRRSQLPQKGFALVDRDSLGHKIELQTLAPSDARADLKLCCIFTGQGAQWLGMGAELTSYPVFNESLKASDRFLAEAGCRWSVFTCLDKAKKSLDVNSAAVSQPICSAIQIALVDLLRSFQIRPSVVLGHSSGEIAAAYCIGAISARSAIRLAYYRGTLSDRLAKSEAFTGAMMAAGLSPEEAEQYLEQTAKELKREKLTIACINSPQSVTISGEQDHLIHLQALFNEKNVFSRLLKVPVAYHSSQMRMIADEYDDSIQNIEAGDVECNHVDMISSVTGEVTPPKSLRESKYWVKNLVSPVRFSDAVLRTIARSNEETKDGDGQVSEPHLSFLEVGPHSTLQAPVQNTIESLPHPPQWNYQSLLVRNRDSVQTLLTTIGKLHCLGHTIDLTTANNIDRNGSMPPVMLTQLPTYAFDHSVHHWAESRLSKGMRFRKHAPHDLLGTLVSDMNPFEPRWRSILQLSDLPSLEDHIINGQVLFPAAAMLTAAIEGARQLSSSNVIVGYEIQNVEFLDALGFSGNTAVEIETRFRQINQSNIGGDDQVRYEFRLYSFQQDKWVLHCLGEIQAEHQQSNVSAAATLEANERTRGVVKAYETSRENIVQPLQKQAMYKHWHDCGYQYGPTFQLLDDAAYTEDGAGVATLVPLSEDQRDITQEHVVHPASLDCAFQLTLASVSKGNEKIVPTMVPTRITRLWITGGGLTVPDPDTVRVHAHVKRVNDTKTKAVVTAFSEQTKKLCLNVEGLESTAIHDSSMALQNQEETIPQLTFRVQWKPDMALLDTDQVIGYCWNSNRDAEREDFLIEREWKVSSWVLHHLAKVEESLKNNAASIATVEKKPHLEKYLKWLAERTRQARTGGYPQLESRLAEISTNPEQLSRLTADLKDDNMTSFFVGIGENLLEVLEGRVEPHEVMFNDNEAANFYQEFNKYSKCGPALEQLLDLMAHKNPDMNLLEIGGGTGATTRVILNGLRSGELKLKGANGENNVFGADRFTRYDFTDISPSLLSNAQEDLGSGHSKMKFSVFDIEKEGEAQGYKKEAYDVVVAADVIHATKDLRATLQNIRNLLKKGGKLVMLELTASCDLLSEFSFGLLSGWWTGIEDYRTTSPLITESQWNNVLQEAGFSGVDMVFRDFVSEECHHASVMVATAIGAHPSAMVSLRPETLLLIVDTIDAAQMSLAETVQDAIARETHEKCAIVSLDEAASGSRAADKTCIFLHEVQRPFFYAISEKSFHELQAILKQASSIVWATNGGGMTPDQPDYGAIQGLSRTLRRENNECPFATVALETGATIADTSSTVLSVIRQLVDVSSDHKYEPEYLQINNLLCISRVVEDLETHEHVKRELIGVDKRERALGDSVPLKLRVAGRQQLHALEYEEDELPSQSLPDDEIEIRVMAAGCNFMDPLAVLGRTNYDFVGSEVAGIVTRIGAAVPNEPETSQQFKAGDKVIAFAFNAFRTHARAKASLAVRKPTALSYSQAASIPVNFCTAYRGLVDVANLKKGETVLIHAAAGGTGQAAVQIARHIGAEIFVTVGSEEKRNFMAAEYDIPRERILHSRDLSFATGIMRLTQNQGVDVVFNSLAGESLERGWECVGAYGRFIEISKRDIMDNAKLSMAPFGPNATFSHVDMESIARNRPRMFGRIFQNVADLIDRTVLTPVSQITVFDAGKIGEALRMLLNGKHHGKVVVTFDDQHTVKATTSIVRSYHFRNHATYVVTGAFGGLGRSMIRWMVRRGARNLLLLSRSGAANDESKELLRELTEQGVRFEAPRCDITNADNLRSVLTKSLMQMPPIRGCIQGAMLLQDQIFENMSHKQFRDIADPKIQGSWNLHALLPDSLDFFILLSSLAGVVGGGGQANYSLANAYQDGLAAYRVGKGLAAVSLNLGPMLTDGYLSRNTDTMQKLTMQDGHRPVTLEELIALLEFYCDPGRSILKSSELEPVQHVAQLANGLNSLAAMQQKGVKKPWYIDFPLFGNLRQIAAADLEPEAKTTKSNARVDFAKLFQEASTEDLQISIQHAVIERLEMALPGLITDESSYNKPLHYLGIDSLFALDLRNWLTKSLKCEISVFEILKLNINDVVQVGMERSAFAKTAV